MSLWTIYSILVILIAKSEITSTQTTTDEPPTPCPPGAQHLTDDTGGPLRCLPHHTDLCAQALGGSKQGSAAGVCCLSNRIDYYCCIGVNGKDCPDYTNVTVVIFREQKQPFVPNTAVNPPPGPDARRSPVGDQFLSIRALPPGPHSKFGNQVPAAAAPNVSPEEFLRSPYNPPPEPPPPGPVFAPVPELSPPGPVTVEDGDADSTELRSESGNLRQRQPREDRTHKLLGFGRAERAAVLRDMVPFENQDRLRKPSENSPSSKSIVFFGQPPSVTLPPAPKAINLPSQLIPAAGLPAEPVSQPPTTTAEATVEEEQSGLDPPMPPTIGYEPGSTEAAYDDTEEPYAITTVGPESGAWTNDTVSNEETELEQEPDTEPPVDPVSLTSPSSTKTEEEPGQEPESEEKLEASSSDVLSTSTVSEALPETTPVSDSDPQPELTTIADSGEVGSGEDDVEDGSESSESSETAATTHDQPQNGSTTQVPPTVWKFSLHTNGWSPVTLKEEQQPNSPPANSRVWTDASFKSNPLPFALKSVDGPKSRDLLSYALFHDDAAALEDMTPRESEPNVFHGSIINIGPEFVANMKPARFLGFSRPGFEASRRRLKRFLLNRFHS